ncbi:MAG: hypothetical protein WHS38_00845 [Thermodesulforhabdaceae bacterium]
MESKFPYHLCQPDGKKSCAACCGIYNFRRNNREDVTKRLRENTASIITLSHSNPNGNALESYSERSRNIYNGSDKLFTTIFNCEFAGFIDKYQQKVGCLLHPSQHFGKDLRDYSFYGAELCENHYCLSYFYLTAVEQRLVIETVEDWYLYGLTITDIDLVKGVFTVLSDLVGEAIDPLVVAQHENLKRIIQSFWNLKLSWPFRLQNTDSFGKYIFKGEEYFEIEIPYSSFNRNKSPYHRIFLSLGSNFQNAEDLEKAEEIVSKLCFLFAKAYDKAR